MQAASKGRDSRAYKKIRLGTFQMCNPQERKALGWKRICQRLSGRSGWLGMQMASSSAACQKFI